jgi:hypothetical protein
MTLEGASSSLRFTPTFTIPPKNKGRPKNKVKKTSPERGLVDVKFVIGSRIVVLK